MKKSSHTHTIWHIIPTLPGEKPETIPVSGKCADPLCLAGEASVAKLACAEDYLREAETALKAARMEMEGK